MMPIFKRLTAVAALAAVVTVGSTRNASAFGFNPWTGMTGEKTIAINPFLYLPLSPVSFGFDAVGWIGLSKKVDLAVNFSSYNTASGYGGFWAMPRLEIFPNGIIGITVGYNGASPYVKPEFDLVVYPENSVFNFEGNLRVPITFASSGVTVGVETYLVPVLKFAPAFAFFCEVNPTITVVPATSFSMPINPGIWLGLGDKQQHQFSLAFTGMSVSSGGFAVSAGLGLSYYTTIGF